MPTTRRDFLERATGAALLGALPLSLDGMTRALAAPPVQGQEKWDVTWVNKITGKH